MNRSRLRVGIVGVGAMGRPVVDRLLAAGHDVAAYVRRPDQQVVLREIGVEIVPSLAALGAGRDFVIIYVYTDEQARSVALDEALLGGWMPGRCSSFTPPAVPGPYRPWQSGAPAADCGWSMRLEAAGRRGWRRARC